MEAIGRFFIYALTAIFLENAVFTRILGVGRLSFFSSTPQKILVHGVLLTGITFVSAMLSYWVNFFLYGREVAATGRAFLFLCCITAVYFIIYFLGGRLFGDKFGIIKRMLPLSAFNCAVLGSLVLATGYQQSFAATAGFGLGTGVGYTLALAVLHAGRRRMELIPLPRAFKGIPIMLLYIGLVSLAIYGLTGHQLPT